MPGTGYFGFQHFFFGEILEGRLKWEICVHQAHPKCGMIESHLKRFRLEPLKAIQFLILSTAMGFQHVSCHRETILKQALRTEEGALAMATKALG